MSLLLKKSELHQHFIMGGGETHDAPFSEEYQQLMVVRWGSVTFFCDLATEKFPLLQKITFHPWSGKEL